MNPDPFSTLSYPLSRFTIQSRIPMRLPVVPRTGSLSFRRLGYAEAVTVSSGQDATWR